MGRIQRQITNRPSISEAGRISIGVNTGRHPKSIDWFRPYKGYVDNFRRAIEEQKRLGLLSETVDPEKPNELLLLFPSEDTDQWCHEYYELRSGKKRAAESDGQNFTLYNKDGSVQRMTLDEVRKDKVWSHVVKHYDDDAETLAAKITVGGKEAVWSHILRLRFLIPYSGLQGYWQLQTRASASSIPGIIAAFDSAVDNLPEAVPFFAVPFKLSVRLHTSDKAGSASRYPVLTLLQALDMELISKLGNSGGYAAIGGGGMVTPDKILQLEQPQQHLLTDGNTKENITEIHAEEVSDTGGNSSQ